MCTQCVTGPPPPLKGPGDEASNRLIDPGLLYTEEDSRVSGCVTGWPVIHRENPCRTIV